MERNIVRDIHKVHTPTNALFMKLDKVVWQLPHYHTTYNDEGFFFTEF